MNETGRDRADGARMSHAEAERLISSRLDAPLDPNLNRALLAHLATCPSCRAFASQMEAMSTGLRALPMLPASPLVTREVRAKIAQQPSPWTRLSTMLFNGRWGAVPAAVAGVALVAVVAVALILHGSGPDQGNTPLAAPSMTHFAATATSQAAETATAPAGQTDVALNVDAASTPKFPNIQVTPTPTATNTAQPTATNAPADTATAPPAPTDTPAATATPQPHTTETATAEPTVTATNTPEATATTTPIETATAAPTETATSEPTATSTVTSVPTETATSAPTETAVPTETATATPTATDTPKPKATNTAVPTDTATATETATATIEPTIGAFIAPAETATATPTEVATPLPAPTDTPTPKPTKTPTPTKTPAPAAPPTIAPAGGQTSEVIETPAPGNASSASNAAPETGNGAAAANETSTSPAIVSSGNETGDGTSIAENTPTGGAVISEITPTAKATRKGNSAKETSTAAAESPALSNAQTLAQFGASIEPGAIVRANPDADLFVVADSAGCIIYDFGGNVVSSIPGGAEPVWTPGGTALLLSAPTDAGQTATVWLAKSQSTFAISASSSKGYVDHPAGADGAAFYFVRAFTDGSGLEVHKTLFENNSDTAIWSGSGQLSGQPVVTDAGVIFAMDGAFHLVDASGNESKLGGDSFGAMQAPLRSPNGSGIAFVAGDQLILTASGQPSSGTALPYSATGGGFAFSKSGSEIAVAADGTLAIYGSNGTTEGQVATGGNATVIAWRSDGIVVLVNEKQPELRVISPSDIKAG